MACFKILLLLLRLGLASCAVCSPAPTRKTHRPTHRSHKPSAHPTGGPQLTPSVKPSLTPTAQPSIKPSATNQPLSTLAPSTTKVPTRTPSFRPTVPSTTSVKLIGYIPGWLTPPPASELAAAGYTHTIVAFGVFSTTSPGTIVNAFSTVSASYVAQLHGVGIRVLLSLGGASTSIPNTSVDFDSVLQSATSAQAFQNTIVASVLSFVSSYGFDGVDFDIEHGLIPAGTFTNPTGDILVLSNIINQLHSQSPSLLISLAPQSANIAATSGFNDPFGNYASLILQTASSLSWVGVQIYNTGCCLGLNQVCYATDPDTNPDFSVAMAADLLENWPSVNSQGQQTGFQNYISPLTPDQVVLGYPCVNANGVSDGLPATPTSTIKRAIQCLRSGTTGSSSCNTYVAPRQYPTIGGVFDWQVYNDQSNGYQFAKDMSPCLFASSC